MAGRAGIDSFGTSIARNPVDRMMVVDRREGQDQPRSQAHASGYGSPDLSPRGEMLLIVPVTGRPKIACLIACLIAGLGITTDERRHLTSGHYICRSTIMRLTSAMALAGLRLLGQALAQFMMVWQR